MSNLRELLKSETSELHQKLESKVAITSERWSLMSYCSLLRRFYSLHTALEKQIALFPELSRYYQDRHKSQLLERDLRELNCALPATADSADALTFFSGLDRAGWWGVLYVIEGSTLGAQVITQHFSKLLNTTPDHGGAFFYGDGPQTASRWSEFVAHLNALTVTDAEASEAVTAARGLFSFLSSHLVDQKPA